MPLPRHTPEQKQEALQMYETEGPTAVEKKLGISKGTVATWAKRAGLVTTVRNENTRKATEAASLDAKVRRQAINARLYGRVEAILSRLEADGYDYSVVTKETVQKVTEAHVPAGEERNHATAIGIYLDKALRLESVDSGERDMPAVDAWLAHMMGK